MANDREIGDLVARFRLLVDESGTKEATLALDRLEKRSTAKMGGAGRNAGAAFAGGLSGALVGQGLLTGIELVGRAAAASIGAFIKAGEEGKLDGAAAQTYIELDNAMTAAGDAANELALAVGENLAPTLTEFLQLGDDILPVISGFVDGWTRVTGIDAAANVLDRLNNEVDDNAGAAKRNAKAAADMAKAHDAVNKILSEQEKRFRSLVDAQIDELESGLRVESAALSRADAAAALAEAEQAVADASTRSAEFSEREADALEAVRDAQDAVADARFRATRAADDLNEAQEALGEATFRYGPQSKEANEAADALAEAQHELEVANREVGEANESVADKQKAYEAALRDGQPTVEKAEEAARNLEKAQLGVRQAQLDSVAAQRNYTTAQALANGETQSAAQYAKDAETALRNLAGYAGGGDFAAKMAAGAANIGQLRGGSSLAGGDGGRAFMDQLDARLGALSGGNNITINVTTVASAQEIAQELDWASRGAGGGVRLNV